jgi:hypothetical protein
MHLPLISLMDRIGELVSSVSSRLSAIAESLRVPASPAKSKKTNRAPILAQFQKTHDCDTDDVANPDSICAACRRVGAQMDGPIPDVVFAFLSPPLHERARSPFLCGLPKIESILNANTPSGIYGRATSRRTGIFNSFA